LIFKRIEKHRFRKFGACSTVVKNNKEYGKTLLSANKRLMGQVADIQHIFRTGNRSVFKTATDYLQGLWRSRLSNLEKITQSGLPDNYHKLQHFISDSPWNHRVLMDHVALESGKELEPEKIDRTYLDESGVSKKGKESVGVAPQYCGNLGKVDNCQVAVFAASVRKIFQLLSIVDSIFPKAGLRIKKEWKKRRFPLSRRYLKPNNKSPLS
jgi:SRSO17 transposase